MALTPFFLHDFVASFFPSWLHSRGFSWKKGQLPKGEAVSLEVEQGVFVLIIFDFTPGGNFDMTDLFFTLEVLSWGRSPSAQLHV